MVLNSRMQKAVAPGLMVLLLSASAGEAEAETDVAAIVGGREISRKAVEEHVKGALLKLKHKRYEVLRSGLHELVAEQLIALAAAAEGKTPEAYVAAEVDAKSTRPDSAMIEEVYESNKRKFAGRPVEEAKSEVENWLLGQSRERRRRVLLTALKEEYETRINLLPTAVDVGTGGRPTLGGDASAPVTLVEFSDYECRYCKRAEPVIREILEIYGDRVRYVYRDFPLAIHKNALPASRAARCAEQQGRFWAYHEKLMESDKLGEGVYRTIAEEVGLDRSNFDSCLASELFADAIDRDVADGKAVGVSATPAFFVNGRMISGAKPLKIFKELIDAELERNSGG